MKRVVVLVIVALMNTIKENLPVFMALKNTVMPLQVEVTSLETDRTLTGLAGVAFPGVEVGGIDLRGRALGATHPECRVVSVEDDFDIVTGELRPDLLCGLTGELEARLAEGRAERRHQRLTGLGDRRVGCEAQLRLEGRLDGGGDGIEVHRALLGVWRSLVERCGAGMV